MRSQQLKDINKTLLDRLQLQVNDCLKEIDMGRENLNYQQRTALALFMVGRDILEESENYHYCIGKRTWHRLLSDADYAIKRGKKNHYNATHHTPKENTSPSEDSRLRTPA